MKCHGCNQKMKRSGPKLLEVPFPKLREVRTGRTLRFCTNLCRSLFMKKAPDWKEYRAIG